MNSHDPLGDVTRPEGKRRAPTLFRFSLLCGIVWFVLILGMSAFQPVFANVQLQATPPDEHTVQQGETLSQIAEKYHVALNVLMFYNGISDPNDIYVGQTLELPPPATPTPADTYQVKSGETLSQIAEAQHVPLDELMRLNDITDPDAVYRGQVLHLPSKNSASTPTATATATDERTTATRIPATPLTASPTATASATATATPTETPEASQTKGTRAATYTIQAGETLSQIAEAQGIALNVLMQFNNITNANTIYQGQVLQLPSVATEKLTATEEAATGTATTTATPTEEIVEETAAPNTPEAEAIASSGNLIASLNQVYTIRQGDSLRLIALRTGVDLEALKKLNHLNDDRGVSLSIGMTLTLPATGSELQPVSHEEQYVVQAGDSLGRIAEKFDRTLTEMLQANYISNPNDIYPGQSLTIPTKKDDTKQVAQVGPMRSGFYYYTVQSGDTMAQIAQRFDSTQLAILDYNDLPDQETVYRGLEVRIPFGPSPLPVKLPPGPASGTRFLVSVSRQQCLVFQGSRVLYSWSCSTGYGEWKTRIGTFAVQSMYDVAKSSAYQLDMPYWLGIYNVGTYENGIHGLPTRWATGKKLWEGLIGQPATFGCAMLEDENAAKLYKMAYIGMPVYIVN
ncbi:MAG: LysM peptidoglycan-binding domain-containing protein [Chloroflexi bacterium]|nr:LysM peptidoglycan-binding domain-containing protein [Chloroflexota bacterium]